MGIGRWCQRWQRLAASTGTVAVPKRMAFRARWAAFCACLRADVVE